MKQEIDLVWPYPKLAGGGGYELLRQDATRQLDVIPIPPGGYSVEYIKNVVHSAKVYIRPLQKSLDMTASSCDVSYSSLLDIYLGRYKVIQYSMRLLWIAVIASKTIIALQYYAVKNAATSTILTVFTTIGVAGSAGIIVNSLQFGNVALVN